MICFYISSFTFENVVNFREIETVFIKLNISQKLFILYGFFFFFKLFLFQERPTNVMHISIKKMGEYTYQ